MAETVVIRQNRALETEFLAADSEAPEPEGRELRPVHAIHELSPYGLLLAGLGACTAILLHHYARNHDVALDAVEMRVTYDREFQKDCETCEVSQKYSENIDAEVGLVGQFTPEERNKLFLISKHCPVHKILHDGIQTTFRLAPA